LSVHEQIWQICRANDICPYTSSFYFLFFARHRKAVPRLRKTSYYEDKKFLISDFWFLIWLHRATNHKS